MFEYETVGAGQMDEDIEMSGQGGYAGVSPPNPAHELNEISSSAGFGGERVVMLGKFIESLQLPQTQGEFSEVQLSPQNNWLVHPSSQEHVALELLQRMSIDGRAHETRSPVTMSRASTPREQRFPVMTASDGVQREIEFHQFRNKTDLLRHVGSMDSLKVEGISRSASSTDLSQLSEKLSGKRVCECTCVVARPTPVQSRAPRNSDQSFPHHQ